MAHVGLHGPAPDVWNDRRLDLAHLLRRRALEDSHHGRLADVTRPGDLLTALPLVHVPRLPADESFVRLGHAAEFLKGAGPHGEAYAVKQEPRRLLRDAERPMYFVAADAVLGVRNTPYGDEPLVQP